MIYQSAVPANELTTFVVYIIAVFSIGRAFLNLVLVSGLVCLWYLYAGQAVKVKYSFSCLAWLFIPWLWIILG